MLYSIGGAILISSLSLNSACRAAIVNALDFGATGNGQSDDTGAIQSALNEARENGGGIVQLPAGQFRLDVR